MADPFFADANPTGGRRRAPALAVALGAMLAAGSIAQAAAAPPISAPSAEPGQSTAKSSRTGSRASRALIRTVEEFTSAQRAFDSAKLAKLTTPDFVEISPVGEVDSREEMLGFYAPDKKAPAPAFAMSEVTVRAFGGAAVLITKMAYTVQPPGQAARTMELRASFVARRVSEDWKIASAQYTPIRPAAK